jgi:hypothetical protein
LLHHNQEEEHKVQKLTKYEKDQVDTIEKWKKEEPGVVSQAFGFAIEPLAWLVNKVVPEKAVRGALDFSNAMAQWLTDTRDVVRDAEVSSLGELRNKDLALSDKLADEVHNWAIGVAVVEGAGTGLFGLPGAAADVPAIITLALRTIHKIGVCYGYECSSKLDKKFVLGVMSASGANSIREKVAALTALRSVEVTLARVTWKKMAERAAESQLSKEAALLSIKNLAKQLGVNITKRKALASIPFIGAAVGGSVNGWYIKEVGWAARSAFQERWLIENGKIIGVEFKAV